MKRKLDKRGLERVPVLLGQRYVWCRLRRLRSKTAVPGQLLRTRWGKRLVVSDRGQLYLATPSALGDKNGKHHHRFRLAYHSGQTATYRCRCGGEKERPLTPAERRRVKADLFSSSGVHKIWHGIQRRMYKKFPALADGQHLCNLPVPGWDMIQFLEREAKRRPQHVLSAHTDDGVFMGSDIFFIAHAAPMHMKRTLNGQPPTPRGGWMGATFIYCPQGGQPAVGFLYPGHVDSMLTALRKLKKLERRYGVRHD